MKMMIINKDYSLLWCGQLVSQLGNRIYLMALAWYFVAVHCQETRHLARSRN